jgi:nucleoside-diphosphate-sugar epimerase
MTHAKRGILLTGATGLLGRYLLRDLLLAGYPVAVLARDAPGVPATDRVAALLDDISTALGRRLPQPVVLPGDVRRREVGLMPTEQRWLADHCGAVVHAAASLAFRPTRDGEPRATNVEGTQHLLDLCRRLRVSEFHHVSTAFVCGAAAGTVFEDDPADGRHFHNAYEATKADAERLVRSTAGLRATIYRPSVIVGDSRTGFTSTYHGVYRFIEFAYRLAEPPAPGRPRRLALRLPLTGDEPRNLVPVDWVAQAIVRLIGRPACHGRTYHLTAPRLVPVRLLKEVAEELLQVEGVRFGGPGVVEDTTGLERLFLDRLEEYWPYLHGDPEFDSRRLQAALPDLPAVVIDRPLVERLVQFAVTDEWGHRGRRGAKAPPAPARTDCRRYVEEVFPTAARRSVLGRAARLTATVALDVRGPHGGQWTCGWVGGDLQFVRRGLDPAADVCYRTDPATFDDVVRGRQSAQDAFFARRIEVAGDVEKALKLAVMFGQFLRETAQADTVAKCWRTKRGAAAAHQPEA